MLVGYPQYFVSCSRATKYPENISFTAQHPLLQRSFDPQPSTGVSPRAAVRKVVVVFRKGPFGLELSAWGFIAPLVVLMLTSGRDV